MEFIHFLPSWWKHIWFALSFINSSKILCKFTLSPVKTHQVSLLGIKCSLFWVSLSLSSSLLLTTHFLSWLCELTLYTHCVSELSPLPPQCGYLYRTDFDLAALSTSVRMHITHFSKGVFSVAGSQAMNKRCWEQWSLRAEEAENGCDCRNNQQRDCDSSPARRRWIRQMFHSLNQSSVTKAEIQREFTSLDLGFKV